MLYLLLPEEKIPPCPPNAACLYLCFPGSTPKYSNLISGSEHNINASTTHFIENVKPRVQETHSQPRLTSVLVKHPGETIWKPTAQTIVLSSTLHA